jgi:hypothetical protein
MMIGTRHCPCPDLCWEGKRVKLGDADLVILIPMLGRPQHVDPLLATIDVATPGAGVLFLCSPHDLNVIREVERAGREHEEIPYYPVGDYARKINHGVRVTDQKLIFLGASDLAFHPGWFEHACEHLRPGPFVVGTNDLGNTRVMTGQHSTHSLVTRQYADLGTIDDRTRLLHEGYPHEYVDDEFVETAKFRHMFESALDSEVEHLHPCWGKGEPDPIYNQQQRRMISGRRIYQHRRRLWN